MHRKNSRLLKRLLFQITAALCLCAGTGCASHKAKTHTSAQKQPVHHLVGKIVSVNQEQMFVLIDTGSFPPPADGAALKSFSEDKETGVLTVSPERSPPFMIANIVSGMPQKGDEVFE